MTFYAQLLFLSDRDNLSNMRASRKRVRKANDVRATASDNGCTNASDVIATCDGADRMRRWAIENWATARWTNVQLCTCAFFHTLSNGLGLKDLCADPSSGGRNHARKVRDALKIDQMFQAEMTTVAVPLYDRKRNCRTIIDLPMRDPRHALQQAINRNPRLYDVQYVDEGAWNVPSFASHPLTKRFGPHCVMPLGACAGKAHRDSHRHTFPKYIIDII